jgi:hypothetical protein
MQFRTARLDKKSFIQNEGYPKTNPITKSVCETIADLGSTEILSTVVIAFVVGLSHPLSEAIVLFNERFEFICNLYVTVLTLLRDE